MVDKLPSSSGVSAGFLNHQQQVIWAQWPWPKLEIGEEFRQENEIFYLQILLKTSLGGYSFPNLHPWKLTFWTPKIDGL